MRRPKTAPADQPGLFAPDEHERARLSMAELDQLIVRTESELSELKRLRRAKLGGLAAAGRPRTRKFKVEDVLEAYAEACGPDGRPRHGARRATAKQLGMTERHLGRVLAGNRGLLERILAHPRRRGPRS